MSGEHLHLLLKKLSTYFHILPLTEVEELFEIELENRKKQKESSNLLDNDDDIPLSQQRSSDQSEIYRHIQPALESFDCIDLFQEIYNEAMQARKESGFKDYDNWNYLVTQVNKSKYLSFMYACISLWQLDPGNSQIRKLSCNASRTYLTLLTIPGAKQCGIFDEDLVIKTFQVITLFEVLNQPDYQRVVRNHDRTQVQLFLISFLEDLVTIFKIVSLREFKDVKKALVIILKGILLHNHVNGYENICK